MSLFLDFSEKIVLITSERHLVCDVASKSVMSPDR